jgi:hypothetical protein
MGPLTLEPTCTSVWRPVVSARTWPEISSRDLLHFVLTAAQLCGKHRYGSLDILAENLVHCANRFQVPYQVPVMRKYTVGP